MGRGGSVGSRRRALVCGVAFTFVSTVTALLGVSSARPETPACAGKTGGVAVVLVTPPNGRVTELHELEPGKSMLGRSLGQVRHAPGTIVKATVVPGSRVVAISAVPVGRRDLSFAATLFLARPGEAPKALVDRLQHGVRPVATAGRVFVARGEPGPEPADQGQSAAMRRDQLTIDVIDLATEGVRTLHRSSGQLLLPVGMVGAGLIIYRVGDTGADFVCVDVGSGAVRPLAQVSPLSRDFALDGAARSVVFTGFASAGPGSKGGWEVQRLHVDDGRLEVVARADAPTLAPYPWPGGGLVYSRPGGGGLTFVDAKGEARWAPLGDGIDAVRAIACRGGAWWAIGLHKASGPFASLFAYDPRRKQVVQVAGVRGIIDIVGVWDASSP